MNRWAIVNCPFGTPCRLGPLRGPFVGLREALLGLRGRFVVLRIKLLALRLRFTSFLSK